MNPSEHSVKEIPTIELQEIVRTGRCLDTYAIILAQAELDRRGDGKAAEACVHSIGCGQYEAAKPEPVEPWYTSFALPQVRIDQLQRKHDALESRVLTLQDYYINAKPKVEAR